jgi:sugar/nucleoside kinase (ribokinase family)
MNKIITFGSATWDAFSELEEKDYRIVESNNFLTGKGLCFSLGSKIIIDQLNFFSGGGGTNSAATFGRQGFKTAYVGKVGDDGQGEMVLEELEEMGVDISMVKKDKEKATAFSLILPTKEGQRSILAYRGACHFLGKEEVPWSKVKGADWFYLAPLSGDLINLFESIIDFAEENNIKIALNPSSQQIEIIKKKKDILSKIDLLVLNNEEAALLANLPLGQEEEMLRVILKSLKGLLVITRGIDGSLISDKENLFKAGIIKIAVRAKTGAGDAFASGFLSGLLEKNSIEYAIRLGTVNAAGCVSRVGAKEGLIKKGEINDWPELKIIKNKINL